MGTDIHVNIAKWDGEKAESLFDEDEYWRSFTFSPYVDDVEKAQTGIAWLPDAEARLNKWRRTRLMSGRNYDRFGKLSGVRTDGPKANGWPKWARELYPHSSVDVDLHSHTCLPIKEAAKIWLETDYRREEDTDIYALCLVNPISMYFNIDPDRPDIDQIYVCVSYDN